MQIPFQLTVAAIPTAKDAVDNDTLHAQQPGTMQMRKQMLSGECSKIKKLQADAA